MDSISWGSSIQASRWNTSSTDLAAIDVAEAYDVIEGNTVKGESLHFVLPPRNLKLLWLC